MYRKSEDERRRSDDGGDDLARVRQVAELGEVDACERDSKLVRPKSDEAEKREGERERTLPRPEREPAVRDGDLERDADDAALRVAHRVVGALVDVFPSKVLPHNLVEAAIHVGAHVGVAVLIDAEPGRGVLEEEEEDADLRVRRDEERSAEEGEGEGRSVERGRRWTRSERRWSAAVRGGRATGARA